MNVSYKRDYEVHIWYCGLSMSQDTCVLYCSVCIFSSVLFLIPVFHSCTLYKAAREDSSTLLPANHAGGLG